jgi:EpsG family
MLLYFLVFLLIAFFSLSKEGRLKKILFICTGILLFTIAAFRGNNNFDYSGYVALYNKAALINTLRIEPTFILISFIVKHVFNNVLFLFIIYAFLGVFLTFYAIKKLTAFYFLSVLIYFSNFFIFHEMTQIRVGVASALILLSLKPLLERNFKAFILIILLAFLFHYSSLIALPLYFLNGNKINIFIFAIIIPLSYLFYFLNIHFAYLIDLIPIPEINIKFQQYKFLSTLNSSKVNVFSYLQLSRCLLAAIFLWKWELLQRNNKFGILLIKIYVIAISLLVLLADIPGLGARASELLLSVEIILIPCLMYVFKQKQLGILIITLIGFLFLYLILLYSRLIII